MMDSAGMSVSIHREFSSVKKGSSTMSVSVPPGHNIDTIKAIPGFGFLSELGGGSGSRGELVRVTLVTDLDQGRIRELHPWTEQVRTLDGLDYRVQSSRDHALQCALELQRDRLAMWPFSPEELRERMKAAALEAPVANLGRYPSYSVDSVPMIAEELAPGACSRRPPRGRMADFVGAQVDFSLQENRSDWELKWDPGFERLRAFTVPALKGEVFRASCSRDLWVDLEAFLAKKLPGAYFRANPNVPNEVSRYGFFHTSLAAPLDQETDQKMALEIFGELLAVGDIVPGDTSDALRLWGSIDQLNTLARGVYAEIRARWDLDNMSHYFLIKEATYSNIQSPDIGVPFYF